MASIFDLENPLDDLENSFVERSPDQPDEITYLESQKGGKILVHKAYMYIRNRVMTSGNTYYTCRDRLSGCKGTLTVNPDGIVCGDMGHNHAANPAKTNAEIQKARFKKNAQRSHTKPRQLYSNLVQELSTDVTGFMPAPHNMARTARRQRKQHLPTPKSRTEIDLEAYFEKSLLRPECVLYDSGKDDPSRMIILKAEDFRYLHQAENWIMDGTFQIVPELFAQLYTIHVEQFGGVFPVVFALLPDKSGATYDKLFKKIREELEAVPFQAADGDDFLQKPYHIVVDFEKAVINSIGKIFPRTTVQGCNFHFGQAVYRKLQGLGLQVEFVNNLQFNSAVRMVLGLAYVPRSAIKDAWNGILNFEGFPIARDSLFAKYMEETWIGQTVDGQHVAPLFPPALWGVYERTLAGIWRTSNNAEGWHGAFGRQVNCAHPGIYKFLDELAKERKHIAVKVDHLRMGGKPAPRDKSYVRLSQTMLAICKTWETAPYGFTDYIERIGHHITVHIQANTKKE